MYKSASCQTGITMYMAYSSSRFFPSAYMLLGPANSHTSTSAPHMPIYPLLKPNGRRFLELVSRPDAASCEVSCRCELLLLNQEPITPTDPHTQISCLFLVLKRKPIPPPIQGLNRTRKVAYDSRIAAAP